VAIVKALASIGSFFTIGFGLWHFFVPKAYAWYSYMDKEATELVVAVRAVNVFFSLSLVLIGLATSVLVWSSQSNPFAVIVMLVLNVVLWAVRVGMQIVFPQGSLSPVLQYGMLTAFVIVFGLFASALVLALLTMV